MMAEVRALTLQDVETGRRFAGRQRRRQDAGTDGDGRRLEETNSRPRQTYLDYRPRGESSSDTPSAALAQEIPSREAGLEHQSSLRSLLSASDGGRTELDEVTIRQIIADCQADGIDVNNLDPSQEEEISQRIALEYIRRQQGRQSRSSERDQRRRHADSAALLSDSDNGRSSRRHHERPHGRTTAAPELSEPAGSRQRLAEVDAAGRPRPRTSSGQDDSRTRLNARSRQGIDVDGRPAARSATDLPIQPGTEDVRNERRRLSQQCRRTTDPEAERVLEPSRRYLIAPASSSASSSPRQAVFNTDAPSNSPASSPATQSRQQRVQPVGNHPHESSQAVVSDRSAPSVVTNSTERNIAIEGRSSPSPSVAPNSHATPSSSVLSSGPSYPCSRCGRPEIQYDLHYTCTSCPTDSYLVCLRCYRLGVQGVPRWARDEPEAPGGYGPSHDQSHVFASRKYLPPPIHGDGQQSGTTTQSPSARLQSGVLCDICHALANDCYSRCGICNNGEWGYCYSCVNQGRHCTHPLLPLGLESLNNKTAIQDSFDPSRNLPAAALRPRIPSIIRGPYTSNLSLPIKYTGLLPMTWTARCDICHNPIQPSNTRFHCPQCNDGDYDICTSCYLSLVSTGKIARRNGHRGWRRCLKGHRMCVVGFEDRDGGQVRVVSEDIVGGLAFQDVEARQDASDEQGPRHRHYYKALLENDPAANQYHHDTSPQHHRAKHSRQDQQQQQQQSIPPSGGIGLRAVAGWGIYPLDDATDELMFPRGPNSEKSHPSTKAGTLLHMLANGELSLPDIVASSSEEGEGVKEKKHISFRKCSCLGRPRACPNTHLSHSFTTCHAQPQPHPDRQTSSSNRGME